MQRRSVLLAVGSTLAAPHLAFARGQLRYTAATAPDAITREVLSRSLPKLDVGPYDPVTNLRQNFNQIIDQNFARMNGQRISMLLDSLSPMEKQNLAQMYTNAAVSKSRSGRLHDLLALRLDGAQLGRASRTFGFAPIYEAVNRMAPAKATLFMENSNPSFNAPLPGGLPLGSASIKPTRFLKMQRGPMPNIEMTILEIYLDYRTAPIGSLGPVAAAYQTTIFSLGHLTLAWSGGYAVGTGISWMLQTYAPSVHDALGAAVYNFFTPIFNLFQSDSAAEIGNSQMSLSYSPFGLGSIAPIFAETGGDYGVVNEWAVNAGGGGCSDVDGCPILQ